MKKISFPLILLVSISLFIVAGASVYARSSGIAGYSQDGCVCHDSNPDPQTTVTITGLPGAYEPGVTYSLTVSVTSTTVTGSNGGFDLSVTAGTLTVTDGTNTQLDTGELVHTNAGSGQRSWSFNWTAPTTGPVTFYVAGMATDGSGTSGDAWDTYDTTIDVIPEFPGIALFLVLAAAIIAAIFLARKMIPKTTVEGKSKRSPTFP